MRSRSRSAAGWAAARPSAAAASAAISSSWLAQQGGDPRPLLGAGRREPVERLGPAGEHRAAPFLEHRLVLVLDGLDDAAQGQQPVEARRRRLDLAGQFVDQRDELGQRLAIDAQHRRGDAGDRQVRRNIAAAKALRHCRAQLRLQRIEAGGEPQPQIERPAVDALDLPDPGDPGRFALGPGKPRHAGHAHRRAPAVVIGRYSGPFRVAPSTPREVGRR